MEYLIDHHTCERVDIAAHLKAVHGSYNKLLIYIQDTENWRSEKPNESVTKLKNYLKESMRKVLRIQNKYFTQLEKVKELVQGAQNDPVQKIKIATIRQIHKPYHNESDKLAKAYQNIYQTFESFFSNFKVRLAQVPDELGAINSTQNRCFNWLSKSHDIINRHFCPHRRQPHSRK
jgi:hypothetical protein